MPNAKLHDDEADISDALVLELLSAQHPRWADLPLSAVPSTGTVNVLYRLGEALCVRLPRTEAYAASLANELASLPLLAPELPIAIPTPVAVGRPGAGYPFPWAVYRWIAGETYAADRVESEHVVAVTLAEVVGALRGVDVAGASRSHRDEPIAEADASTLSSIEALPVSINRVAVGEAWARALEAPAFDGTPQWIHGDLIPPNLLVRDGRLAAVLDFGGVGIGDPAVDVIPAWSVFGAEGRTTFRAALAVDEGTWARARGLALRQAVRIVPYYWETHREFANMATCTIEGVLDDLAAEPGGW